MKRPLRIVARWASLFFGILLLGGCNDVTSDAVEMRFRLNEDLSGTAMMTYYNLGSKATTPGKQSRDFDDIISIWSYRNWAVEDAYTDTRLWVEDGKLNGSLVQHFKDIREANNSDFKVLIDVEGVHLKLDAGLNYETDGLVTPGADTVRTRFAIDEATGDSVLTEIDPEIYTYTQVSWPPGTREFGYTIAPTGEDLSQPTTSLAGTFETFLESQPLFDKRLREYYGHLSRFMIFHGLDDRESLERERQEICQALKHILSAPDPDPETLMEIAWMISKPEPDDSDPELFGEDQCQEERLNVTRMAAWLNPDNLWARGLVAEALGRSGHQMEAISEIDQVLALPVPADSLEAARHEDLSAWIRELRKEIAGGN